MDPKHTLWPRISAAPLLRDRQIQVLAWDLELPATKQDWQILDAEETARGRRFVFPHHRNGFVRAHALLRRILGYHYETEPAALGFSTDKYGKPSLRFQRPDSPPLHFNLSHSADLAVAAFSRSHSLGVDIEAVRSMSADIAEHHFSPSEQETLRGLQDQDWLDGFFRCWTSKEALLKGEGLGLHLPLDCFDVETDPYKPPALLATRTPGRDMPSINPDWKLQELRPAPGYLGTLAFRPQPKGDFPVAIECFFLNE